MKWPGVTYENIDDYLEGKTLDPSIAKTIEGWYLKTEHKRRPPITVFDDFWKIVSPRPACAGTVLFAAKMACYTGWMSSIRSCGQKAISPASRV